MSNALATKLQRFRAGLDDAERANFTLLLALAAGALAPGAQKPAEGAHAEAFETVSAALARKRTVADTAANGILYRGRPEFISRVLLLALQQEAHCVRPHAQRCAEHFLGYGAPIADTLAVAEPLLAFVRAQAGDVVPTGIASFVYYDEPGQGIDPHVDTDVFALNVLLMLEHVHGDGPPSKLVLFPPQSEPEELLLEPGEMLLMRADSVLHARQRIGKGESLSILTFGFKPR